MTKYVVYYKNSITKNDIEKQMEKFLEPEDKVLYIERYEYQTEIIILSSYTESDDSNG
jgi:hypothetical protein